MYTMKTLRILHRSFTPTRDIPTGYVHLTKELGFLTSGRMCYLVNLSSFWQILTNYIHTRSIIWWIGK